MDTKDNKRLGKLIIQLAHKNKAVREAAIIEIYSLVGKILYTVGNTCYPTKEDVEDSVQNLMLSLFVNAKRYRKDENACGWIMQIYRNTFLNFDKHKKLEAAYFKKQVQILCEQNSDFKDYSDKYFLLNYVIGELQDDELELFYLRYLYEYSIQEIANVFKKPKSTIQYQIDKLELKIKNLLTF